MSFLPKKWLGLIALVPTVALSFMDQTILPVALPTIQRELGGTPTQLQWCINAYLLAVCVFVLACGKLSDRLGARKILSFGMFLFALSSILCGISPNIEVLIAARGLQGLGSALMFSSQNKMVATVFEPENRGRASGIVVSLGSVFMILAPLIGGYLTETFSWRWIFWINLPIAMIGLWLIHKYLPKIEPRNQEIDLLGFLFFVAGVSSLTIFFMQLDQWGWISTQGSLCALLALVSLSLLAIRERKIPHPFLDLTLFKRPIYAAINVSISITQFILMITVFQTIYFQNILGLTPIETGLLSFFSCIPMFFNPLIAGFLSDRFGPRIPISIGYFLLISSLLWLSIFATPSLYSLMLALVAFVTGITFILTPSYSAAMSSVPPQKLGIAFGMLITLRMFAATLGLALIHFFVSKVQESWTLIEGAREAEIRSFSRVHFGLAVILLIAYLLTFAFYRRKSTHKPVDFPAEGWD